MMSMMRRGEERNMCFCSEKIRWFYDLKQVFKVTFNCKLNRFGENNLWWKELKSGV